MGARRSATHELPAADLPEAPRTDCEDTLLEGLDVKQALARLSPADRLIVRLRYEDDLTNPVIASTLGLSVSNVKVRLHRLRAKLEQALPSP